MAAWDGDKGDGCVAIVAAEVDWLLHFAGCSTCVIDCTTGCWMELLLLLLLLLLSQPGPFPACPPQDKLMQELEKAIAKRAMIGVKSAALKQKKAAAAGEAEAQAKKALQEVQRSIRDGDKQVGRTGCCLAARLLQLHGCMWHHLPHI